MSYNDFSCLQNEQDELVQISRAQLEQLLQQQKKPQLPQPQKKACKQIVIKQTGKKPKTYQFADVNYWTNTAFDWDINVLAALKGAFGKEQFKVNQKAIINCVLAGKDVFVCMPTGYGKSITFQIPAYIEDGVTIVVMPLISLIYDQVQYLTSIGIPTLNISGQNRIYTAKQILELNIKLIYTTPGIIFVTLEKLEKSEFFKSIMGELYSQNLIKRFVIDEAHCVSKWGRDFRPDYLKLSNVRNEYKGIPIIALTATAPEEVKEDIIDVLQIKGCLYLQSSFNRPNLIYSVKLREDYKKTVQEIGSFINLTYPRQSGIIYCLTQQECQTLAKGLQALGMDADFYHAGLTEKERHKIHKNWLMNEVQVIVATIAFGMGIDKRDCRFVIHFQMPKSIENYYQESGRAGRDGKLAHCILYYSNQDYKTNLFLMDQNTEIPQTIKKYNIKKLDQMQAYCYERIQCRRVLQLSYLGENFDRDKCNKLCDNCARDETNSEKIDLTREALAVLQAIQYYPLTETQLISCLKGQIDKKKNGKYSDSVFGLFKKKPHYIVPLLNELRSQKVISQKVQQYSVKGKFNTKVVYLTATDENINSVQSVVILYQAEKERKSSIYDNRTNELFKKYLQKENNNIQNQTTNGAKTINWNSEVVQEPEIQKLKYDQTYGYCLENQFNDIRERLMLVRKNIYREMTNDQSNQILNIDLVLSTDDIEELCKKLPESIQELNEPDIHIAKEIKKLQYMTHFINEVAHFIDIEEIDKSKFEKTSQTENQVDQVFEFQKHIKEDDDVELITNPQFLEGQKSAASLINSGEQNAYLDELLGLMPSDEEDEKQRDQKNSDAIWIIEDEKQNDYLQQPKQNQRLSAESQSQSNQGNPQSQLGDGNTLEKKKLKINLKNLKRQFL